VRDTTKRYNDTKMPRVFNAPAETLLMIAGCWNFMMAPIIFWLKH
jgi:hypothetical protein